MRDVPSVLLEVKAEGFVLVCGERQGQLQGGGGVSAALLLTGHVVGVNLGDKEEDDEGRKNGHSGSNPEGARSLGITYTQKKCQFPVL